MSDGLCKFVYEVLDISDGLCQFVYDMPENSSSLNLFN